MATFWQVTAAFSKTRVAETFETLGKVFSAAADGVYITSCPISRVVRVEVGDEAFFVKTYTAGGKKLRRWLGRSRARAEWENLQFFKQIGISTPVLVAYGQETRGGLFKRAALVTAEVKDASDLDSLYAAKHSLLTNREWVADVSRQVAQFTRQLHKHHFAHIDLKWRNILVTLSDMPKVYFFDCPAGKIKRGPVLDRWFIKDIACLDKGAKKCLSRTQRLKFFMDYAHLERLGQKDKGKIQQILSFFEGRE